MKLTQIDDLLREDYYHLQAEDDCYFLGEYVKGAGFEGGDTNQLVLNFKKPVDRENRPEWWYKLEAIERIAQLFKASINEGWIREATLVPIPPSAAKTEPEYDDRMLKVLRRMEGLFGGDLDIRDLIYQTESTRSSHLSERRLSLNELRSVYRLDGECTLPRPSTIAVFDDLLASGTHFKVAKETFRSLWPGIEVIGFFVARSLH